MAFSIGISLEEFKHMTPKELGYCVKGYQEKLKVQMQVQDRLNWYMGQYAMSALESTVCNGWPWRGKGSQPHRYIEKPILQSAKPNEKEKNQYKESQEEIAVFETKQRIKVLRMQGLPESPE